MPTLASTASFAFILLSLFTIPDHVRSSVVVQDPMQASANSFGWLAIRNFTYCLSDHPDPPDKPRGVQPKTNTIPSLSDSSATTKRLTGMGDSVVVLYHPEQTNKAIAWCNTLVAMQSGEHVRCHIALPTCQRCDAVRPSPSSTSPNAQLKPGSKAPSGKLGKRSPVLPRTPPTARGDDGLVALQKRASSGGKADPNDPWIPAPKEVGIAKPFGREQEYAWDPELEPAIAEFQDYCENKLTLAVRADCPFHLVKGWSDEPPFDLHRFCMSLMGNDGHTLHTEEGTAGSGSGGKLKLKASQNGGSMGVEGGKEDPDDPLVPFPEDAPPPSQGVGQTKPDGAA